MTIGGLFVSVFYWKRYNYENIISEV